MSSPTTPSPLGPHERYAPGTTLKIYTHRPPKPFLSHYAGPRPRRDICQGDDYPDSFDLSARVDFALHNPPLSTPPCSNPQEGTLTIIGDLSTRDFTDVENSGGPHVVTCLFDDEVPCVAKIYDAVDYPLIGFPECDVRPRTAFYRAFSKPRNEKFKGMMAPTYYGSWTFALPTHHRKGKKKVRWVRMILMEHLQGSTMQSLISKAFSATTTGGTVDYYALLPPEQTRLSILKQVLEARLKLFWNLEIELDILNTDNIFICQPDNTIRLISFTGAKVYRHLDPEVEEHQNTLIDERYYSPLTPAQMKPYVSPFMEYWPGDKDWVGGRGRRYITNGPFMYWLPQSWVKSKRNAVEWLIDTFGTEEEMEKYETTLPELQALLENWEGLEDGPREKVKKWLR
ncbi:hypothetical protein QBC40DRAFT_219005 [Triangularia verruculosa]|uniref:Uncharacterized protein n=1 Tax=Triangularia verruculosa TaxID=2587418 RepID=A0AAN7AYE0_9PEZI|nr:hypothetical protein QBC40DRAFT_219005 [Triangularia verruculosa]